MRLGERRVHCVELRPVGLAEIGRRKHSGDEHGNASPVEFGQHGIEIGLRLGGIEAPQHVVGAEPQDHEVRLLLETAEHPGEPCASGGRRVCADPGVLHGRGDALRPQRPLELRREAVAGLQPVARHQGIAIGHDEAGGRGGRRRGEKQPQREHRRMDKCG